MKIVTQAPRNVKLPALVVDPQAELRRRAALATLEAAKMVEAIARATCPVGETEQLRARHGTRPTMMRGWPAAEVVDTAPYAKVVHDGRGPGKKWPPPGVLRAWMRFKGIEETGPAKEDTKYGNIEFLIARKIGRVGQKGRPWLREAATKNRDRITAIMRRHMGGNG